MSNIKIGNNTVTGVNSVKFENADNPGNYITFNNNGGKVKHWTITVPSRQTTPITAVSRDSDVADNYNSENAIAYYYHTASTKSGRYKGVQYNIVNPLTSQYGYYFSTGSNSYASTALSNPYTAAKAMVATNTGDIIIPATVTNYIQSGTIEVYFMW